MSARRAPNAIAWSPASTIFVRIALGTLLERFGPVNVQSGLLTFGAIWVAAAAGISAPWNYTLIRFFIGCAGATFVTNQFWCSHDVRSERNWHGECHSCWLGQPRGWCDTNLHDVGPFQPNGRVWCRPGYGLAGCYGRAGGDVPDLCSMHQAAVLDVSVKGKPQKPSMMDYLVVLKDFRVVVMIFQYSACFGAELAMNNQLATHVRTYFQMAAADASALAGSFGPAPSAESLAACSSRTSASVAPSGRSSCPSSSRLSSCFASN